MTKHSVSVRNVSVELPIYQLIHQSLKRQLIRIGSGGRLGQDDKKRVVVRALRNVSLEIEEGERLGIIGLNGAGKTTLLKTIAGIYEPTSGEVETHGQLVSLTNITLGIDDHATGFENITLRGLMMGLSKSEIKERAEDIAKFAELGDFMHLPVRTYSSGMRVRLAFAISTSVDPDILVMDEWLGAGDRLFRERAQERMHGIVGRSRIVVLASHSTSLIKSVCTRAVLLHQGEIIDEGDVEPVLEAFEKLRRN